MRRTTAIGWATSIALVLGSAAWLTAEERGLKQVLDDKQASDAWIYDDLDAGIKQSMKSGKPMLLSFVCVP
ncbi:MAG: hypothetical protein QNJ98_11590 [Planctomycetota bacterium]|nr:hypothetical protein [Planctomycetota bacterium]